MAHSTTDRRVEKILIRSLKSSRLGGGPDRAESQDSVQHKKPGRFPKRTAARKEAAQCSELSE